MSWKLSADVMKRGAPRDLNPANKRGRVGPAEQQAFYSGALATSNAQGYLNQELSTLPEQSLYAVTADLARAREATQATQGNTAIGSQWGRLTDGDVTNPALLNTLYEGNDAPDFPEVASVMERPPDDMEPEDTPRDPEHGESNMPQDMDDEEEEEEKKREQQQGQQGQRGFMGNDPEREKGMYTNTQNNDVNDPSTASYTRKPFTPAESDADGSEAPAAQQPNESQPAAARKGRYETELLPFLPVAGGDLFRDTTSQQQEKSLNLALFDNLIRNQGTGDANINPLQMGLVINDSWRFSGENKVFDYTYPGGALNIGALPVGTERLFLPPDILRDCHAKFVSDRQLKARETLNHDYRAALFAAAASAMPSQMRDVQWTNNNKGNHDSQHSTQSNNTMPMDTDYWEYRPQLDGDVPLQNNLLPAGVLQTTPFGNEGTYIYTNGARSAPTFNPSFRFGWQPVVPFY
jgi:hypothetical protein